LLLQLNTNAQEIIVPLGKTTTQDYLSKEIKSFRDEPGISPVTEQLFNQEKLLFPKDTTNSFFFSVYAGSKKDDSHLAIMVIPSQKGEHLYIDLNNDNNLTNDGGPFFFSKSDNEFAFFIKETADSSQKSGRLLLRYPREAFEDSTKLNAFKKENFDKDGNLNEYWTNNWRRHNPSFNGKKGSFYYIDRLNIRQGKITIDNSTYTIALYDWSANGLYNDEHDKLMVDLNQDSNLSHSDSREIFGLNESLTIQKKAYKVSQIDPYGERLTLKKVNKKTDPNYISFSDSIKIDTRFEDHFPARLNEEFWKLEFKSLNENLISVSSLKGQFILINFWGEWCKPCYKEIPLFVEANKMYPAKKLRIISFLKTYNMKKAREVILKNNMDWIHVRSNQKIENDFKVSTFPRNILVYPDGKKVLLSGGIEKGFFDYYIK
jgi:thiol-disulfide isomerase/thioredoxin